MSGEKTTATLEAAAEMLSQPNEIAERIRRMNDFLNRWPPFVRVPSTYGNQAPLPLTEPVHFLRVDGQPIVHHETVIIRLKKSHAAKNRRRAAARYRARERKRNPPAIKLMTCLPPIMDDLRREPTDGDPLGDKPKLAASDMSALAAVPVTVVPEPAAELPACWCGMRQGEKGCNRNIFVRPHCARLREEKQEPDVMAVLRDIARGG